MLRYNFSKIRNALALLDPLVWGDINGDIEDQDDLINYLVANYYPLVGNPSGFELQSNKGTAGGYAELDGTGKVPSAQLPSFVDDVIEAANFAALPVTGESGKIYVTLDDGLTFRWSGSAYVEISSSLALGETSTTAYRGDRGKIAYDHSQLTTGNPHNVTKSDVGLGSVENTALSTWAGTTNITTLGTIATGVWQGTAIADTYISSATTWNGKQAAYTILSTLGALANASGVLTNNGSGGLSWAAGGSGVTSVATNNGITGGTITSTGTLSLDLTYAPTWTGIHTFNNAGIAVTSTDGIVITNNTAATSGVPNQWSGRIRQRAQVWNTTSVAANNTMDWITEVQTTSGASPTSNLVISVSNNGGAYATRFNLSSGNGFGFGSTSAPYFSGTSSGGINITHASASLTLVNDSSNNGYIGNVAAFLSGGITNSLGLRGQKGISFGRGDGTAVMFIQQTSGNVSINTSSTDQLAKFSVAGSITAATAIARGVYFNNTLVAAANNDVLVGLDVSNTFTNGAFTGVSNIAIRTNSNIQVIGGTFVVGSMYKDATFGLILAGVSGSTSDLALTDRAGNVALKVSNGGALVIGGTTVGAIRVGLAGVTSTTQIYNDATYGSVVGGGAGTSYDAGLWDRNLTAVLAIKNGGSVCIGAYNGTYSAVAALDIVSTSKGVLLPRMTTTQANAITSVEGLILYDSTLHNLKIKDNSVWNHIVMSDVANSKVTAAAPYTNDGYISVNIGGTIYKLMTTA